MQLPSAGRCELAVSASWLCKLHMMPSLQSCCVPAQAEPAAPGLSSAPALHLHVALAAQCQVRARWALCQAPGSRAVVVLQYRLFVAAEPSSAAQPCCRAEQALLAA